MAKGAAPRLKGLTDTAKTGYERSIPRSEGEHDEILSGYRGFAGDGGFSPDAIRDIRARAISPTRAIYANANRDISRQRTLQGGYSPNYTAAKSQMARNMSSQISDQNQNANAGIAQMQQQGRLAGLGGMLQTHQSAPGLTQMYGNQATGAASALGSTPGDFQQGFNNVMAPINAGAKLIYPWLATPSANGGYRG